MSSDFPLRQSTLAPGRLLQCRDAGVCDLLVILRLYAGHADRTDALVLVDDRKAAPDRQTSRIVDECRALLYPLFPSLGRLPGERSPAGLAERDFRSRGARTVQAFQQNRTAASSTMTIDTFQLFFCASALQAAIILWASADVRQCLVRISSPFPSV
jgi:hypothetical protein